MARLAVSELTTLRWTFEEDVEHYAAAGLSGIGVWRHKLADVGDEKGIDMLLAAGLAVSSLQWAGGFTGSDGRSHEDSLEDACQAVRLASAMQASCLLVHSGARGTHTFKHARRLFREALNELLPFAEDHEVTLAIEPMHGCGADWTFLSCLDETLAIADSYDSPFLRIALDTYHWGHEPSLLARLPQIAPRIALVQLGDARQPLGGEPNRCQLGDGLLPLRSIINALTVYGYDGFYEVELMGEEIEAADYQEVLTRSCRTFNEWTAASVS